MRLRSKKTISLLLSFMIMLLTLAGCGKSADKTTGQTNDGKKMKVSFAAWVSAPMDKDSWLEQELEKLFPDIDFDLMAFERDTFMDQLNTRIAGGDIPDIIYRYERPDVEDLVRMGVLTEVPFDMIKKNAPKYLEATKNFGSDVWMACNVDGKNYGLPYMQQDMKNGTGTNAWRMDWLEKVGIDKVPETLPEMEEALKRFVNNDPDGNGKNDTYGILAEGKTLTASQCFSAIYMAYGVNPLHWFLQPDGSVKLGMVTTQAREALKLISRWYKEGLIDPEYVVSDGKEKKEKWASNKGGYLDSSTWTRLVSPDGEFYSALMQANPNAKIALAPAIKGPEGKYGYPSYGGITSSLVFGSQLQKQPEKLARILQVLEKIGTDKEVHSLMAGQESVHWNRDPKTRTVTYVDQYKDAKLRGPLGTNFFHFSSLGIPGLEQGNQRIDYDEVTKYAKDKNVIDGKDYFPVVRLLIPSDVLQRAQDTQNVAAKWEINFVTGVKSVDTDWDDFINEWNAAGGTELTKAANEAYKTSLSTMDSIQQQIK